MKLSARNKCPIKMSQKTGKLSNNFISKNLSSFNPRCSQNLTYEKSKTKEKKSNLFANTNLETETLIHNQVYQNLVSNPLALWCIFTWKPCRLLLSWRPPTIQKKTESGFIRFFEVTLKFAWDGRAGFTFCISCTRFWSRIL